MPPTGSDHEYEHVEGVVVTEPAREFPNDRQLVDYEHERTELVRWMAHLGEDPEQVEGHSYDVVKRRATASIRSTEEHTDGYTTAVTHEHADAYTGGPTGVPTGSHAQYAEQDAQHRARLVDGDPTESAPHPTPGSVPGPLGVATDGETRASR